MAKRQLRRRSTGQTLTVAQKAMTLRRRGDQRGALRTLQQACMKDDQDPALWALYGAHAVRAGKLLAAREAFGRALWLRERLRQSGRVRILKQLLEDVRQVLATA